MHDCPAPGPPDDRTPLRTDEQRALRLLQDGRWLSVADDTGGHRRAWVQLSRYRGDFIPVGGDVAARLLDAGYLRPWRRLATGERRYHLTPAGTALTGAAHARGCVLIVDDDDAIRALLAAILADEGYAVQTAADGAEGLAAVARARPRAVLLDMHMPVLDGWGFAAALRERDLRVPIAVMTAAREVRTACHEVGGDACLPKPFTLDAVLDTLARLCPA
jgi:two-component system chemotaxis response regulator CheY